MADLRPYRVLNGGMGEYWSDRRSPDVAEDIVHANAGSGLDVVPARRSP